MHSFLMKSGLIACAASTYSFNARAAQEAERIYELEAFVVSAGPLARSVEDFASPFSTLDSAEVHRANSGTLGDLLDGQPGVTASSFGAGASRPIIRGFDGPRVRILKSGIEATDVSATSPDHATALEPLLVERVEILRGPSTLLYGSSAIGGVVNVIGREIPREPVGSNGYDGSLETRYDTASDGWTNLGYGTIGGEHWAIRVTGLKRETEDYRIPGEAELHEEEEHDDNEDHEEAGAKGRLENSFVETDAWSVGGTWFFNEGNYFGLSYSQYTSLYGVPGHAHEGEEEEEAGGEEAHGEEAVSIDLEQKRFDAELALYEPLDWLAAVRLRFGYTDYQHVELEGGATGTTFESEGWELRGEAAHQPWWIFDQGVLGFQVADHDFSAIGAEAFTPAATTRSQALFLSEHIHHDALHYEFGGRLERQSVTLEETNKDYSDLALSLAASVIWNFAEKQSLALALQRSKRHPSSTELYADGPHLATSQYEVGDPGLDLETAYGADLTYRYSGRDWTASVSGFYTTFENFIYAEETDAVKDDLPVYQFTAVDARFWGFEGELEHVTYRSGETELRLRLLADYVRAIRTDSDEDLPRIPPLRIGGGMRLTHGDWEAGLLLRRTFNQDQTAPGETGTAGYTELKVDFARSFDMGDRGTLTFFAQANNLLDEEIRHHTSFLKSIAPQPGRSLSVGARYEF